VILQAPIKSDKIIEHAGRVAVLMGGYSDEREISINSGQAIFCALRDAGVDAVEIDWDGSLESVFVDSTIDRYFIALHGRGGEDGHVQAALELKGLPYTGTRVLGCSLSMDKSRAKLALLGAGVRTPPFKLIGENTDGDHIIEELGLPLMIKPAREGSSLGARKIKTAIEFDAAFRNARQFDNRVLAERWIEGCDYTLAIVENSAFPLIKIETPHDIYDYEAKYLADTTQYICPCGLAVDEERRAAELGLNVFNILDGYGWGRVDFMRDEDGTMWVIELNTVPGMTDHSLVPMAARSAGVTFEELVLSILASSFEAGVLVDK